MIRKYNFWVGTLTNAEILAALASGLRHGNARTRCEVNEFERRFAQLLSVPQAYAFAAGRMALFAILDSIREPGRDEVILPAYTCVVVPTAILYAGYRPVYVDVSPNDFQVDVAQVSAAITARTRAVLAPHNFGLPCDIGRLQALAASKGLVLIEDCAQSLGTRLHGRHLGTFGDFSFFSTDTTKNFCTGFGGVAVVNNAGFVRRFEQIYQRAGILSTGQTVRILIYLLLLNALTAPALYRAGKYLMAAYRRTGLAFMLPGCDRLQPPRGYPYPARLSNVLAGLGLGQLRKFEAVVAHRRQIYHALADVVASAFSLPQPELGTDAAPLRVSFLVERRPEFKRFLANFVEVGSWFDTIFQNYTGDPSIFGYREGQCPSAEFVARHIVNLPTSPRSDKRFLAAVQARLQDRQRVSSFVIQPPLPGQAVAPAGSR